MHGEQTGERTDGQTDERTVLKITGTDRVKFLQDLVTNDITGPDNALIYAALLSPQGKYLFDFFLFKQGDAVFLDAESDIAAPLAQRLNLYKLRADVVIEASDLLVSRGLGTPPDGALPDPRHPALGWRFYDPQPGSEPIIDWAEIRVAHVIPQTGVELIANETYILEAGFERLNGVDFRKGCYVGQEVTARMKHKTELRKGLTQVVLDGSAPAGAAIMCDGKAIGQLHSVAGNHAIAYVRFDRTGADMTADGIKLRLA